MELTELQAQHRAMKESLEEKVRNLACRLAKTMEANKQLEIRCVPLISNSTHERRAKQS